MNQSGFKPTAIYLMSLLYIAAGVNHFWHPQTYLQIMPPFLPFHETFNYIAGVSEVLLGFLLLFKKKRNMAAWGLVVLLVLIFPANIQMTINYSKQNHPHLWLSYLRLPLQGLLIWWSLIYTNWYETIKWITPVLGSVQLSYNPKTSFNRA